MQIKEGFGLRDTSAKWQVVFKTAEGLDYCRETLPATMTYAQVYEWTAQQCHAHKLAGAQINRF